LQHVDEEDKQACHKSVSITINEIHVSTNEEEDVYPQQLVAHIIKTKKSTH
jgi:hypothetical protein